MARIFTSGHFALTYSRGLDSSQICSGLDRPARILGKGMAKAGCKINILI